MNPLSILNDHQGRDAFSVANLIYNPEAYAALERMAEMLCAQSGMVPEHLRENKGDMMAIIMQAGRWGLDPLMVAQCTFSVNGIIGYEAKLMQAIVKSTGGLWFTGEYYGPWEKIIGKTRTTQVTKKGKYGNYQVNQEVINWSSEDELGVGYIITGHFPDGRTEEMDIPLITCKPRHSTNWVYDTRQQIHYTGVKRFVRRFAPDLAIGVRDYDDAMSSTEKEINPITEAPKPVRSTIADVLKMTKCDELISKIKDIVHYDDYDRMKERVFEAVKSGQLNDTEIEIVQNALVSAMKKIEKVKIT